MAHIGDILNILAMVGVLLVGVFGIGRKKKKMSEQGDMPPVDPSSEEGGKNIFERGGTFDTWQTILETVMSPPPAAAEPSEQKPKETVVQADLVPRAAEEQVKPSRRADPPPQDDREREIIRMDTADDARRAFIYSEIFQRKY